MTTFSYTSGNPNNLTAGATANMTDISGPFSDLKTFVNGGNLDFTNIGSVVQSDYNTIVGAHVGIPNSAGGTYVFSPGLWGTGTAALPQNLASTGMYLDPADYALTSRTAKYRLRIAFSVNAVAPGVTFTFGLATPTISFGTSGNTQTVTAVAAVGSTAVVSAPGASATTTATSADFSAPSAGYLVPYVIISANMGAGSVCTAMWQLQRRTV